MPTWLDYHTEYLPSGRRDAEWCGMTMDDIPIYVARTLHRGYYVPGYAVNGVGFFVSKERQIFQILNFQVLVGIFLDFDEFRQNEPHGLVADDEAVESERIKIGSFMIDGARYCGMVDNQNTCHINFDGQVHSKEAPELKIFVELMTDGASSASLYHDSSIERESCIKHADKMPNWINYRPEYLMSRRTDAELCGFANSNQPIYVARTLHHGYYVPGYAVNGVGFFVSKERQRFQTDNFQVLVNPSIFFVNYTPHHEKGLVADAGVEKSKRIKIGSFVIEEMRFCGLVDVDTQKSCYINFDDQVYHIEAPEFQVLLELEALL